MSGRTQRINNQIKRDLGAILQQEMNDPRIEFVSITRVDCSPDLHNAKIYYSVLGDQSKHEDAANALFSAAGIIRKMLSQRMNLRLTPQLTFIFDRSIESSFEIERAIQDLHEDDA